MSQQQEVREEPQSDSFQLNQSISFNTSVRNWWKSDPGPAFLPLVRRLHQQAPGRLVVVTLQLGVDDGAGSSAHRQLLSGLHLVPEVSEPALRVHLKLLLQGGGAGV